MINFTNPHMLGFIPEFFSEHSTMSAREQLHVAYAHGGGVNPFKGFQLNNWENTGEAYLAYPGDPPMREIGRAKLRDELIIVFNCAWVAIVQPDGEFIVTRVD